MCCSVLLEPTWMLYRVPRVSPGVTAPILRSPPSRATPGPPLPYRPLQSARYYYPVGGGAAWSHVQRTRVLDTQGERATLSACTPAGNRGTSARKTHTGLAAHLSLHYRDCALRPGRVVDTCPPPSPATPLEFREHARPVLLTNPRSQACHPQPYLLYCGSMRHLPPPSSTDKSAARKHHCARQLAPPPQSSSALCQ